MPQSFGNYDNLDLVFSKVSLNKDVIDPKTNKKRREVDKDLTSIMQQELDKLNEKSGKNVSLSDLLRNLQREIHDNIDDFNRYHYYDIDENNEISEKEIELCYADIVYGKADKSERKLIRAVIPEGSEDKQTNTKAPEETFGKISNIGVTRAGEWYLYKEGSNIPDDAATGELQKKIDLLNEKYKEDFKKVTKGSDVKLTTADVLSTLAAYDINANKYLCDDEKDKLIGDRDLDNAFKKILKLAEKNPKMLLPEDDKIQAPDGLSTTSKKSTNVYKNKSKVVGLVYGKNCKEHYAKVGYGEDNTASVEKNKSDAAKENQKIAEENQKNRVEHSENISKNAKKSKEEWNKKYETWVEDLEKKEKKLTDPKVSDSEKTKLKNEIKTLKNNINAYNRPVGGPKVEEKKREQLTQFYAEQKRKMEEFNNDTNKIQKEISKKDVTVKKSENTIKEVVKDIESQKFSETKELFGDKSTNVSDNGKKILDEFISKDLNKIFTTPGIYNKVEKIVIEGHTDSHSYSAAGGNSKLSADRALAVKKYLMENVDSKYRELLSKILVIEGKGSNEPILDEKGKEDFDKSRRVEIKVKLKGEKN